MDNSNVGYYTAQKKSGLTTAQKRKLNKRLKKEKLANGEAWLPIGEYKAKLQQEKIAKFCNLPLEEKIKIISVSIDYHELTNKTVQESSTPTPAIPTTTYKPTLTREKVQKIGKINKNYQINKYLHSIKKSYTKKYN